MTSQPISTIATGTGTDVVAASAAARLLDGRGMDENIDNHQRNDQTMHSSAFPSAVVFIVGNEFCERFSFYGIRAVLLVYLVQFLLFSQDSATSFVHAFNMTAYSCTLIGGVLSDSLLGKFRTIVYLSLIYSLGNFILSITAIPGIAGTPDHPQAWGVCSGLLLLALGTGGIKPCVSAFGGDQFHPSQTTQIATFFSMFYFAINSGSVISTIVTPILRGDVHCFGREDCFPLAFGVPSILMLVSTAVFIAGHKTYNIYPPSGNILKQVYRLVVEAVRNKRKYSAVFRNRTNNTTTVPDHIVTYQRVPNSLSNHPDNNFESSVPLALPDHFYPRSFLDYALLSNLNSDDNTEFTPSFVNDVSQLFSVLRVFIPLPIFWTLFDQQSSRWTIQAQKMAQQISFFGTHMTVKPEQMQVTNSILILTFIPLFDRMVYPFLARHGINLKPLHRMAVGMALAGSSFVFAAILQLSIDKTLSPTDLNNCIDHCIPILWQIPQYVLITAGEIMFSITGLQFAYSQSPASMKSVCQASWQLTVAIGNLFVIIIAQSHFFNPAPELFFFATLIFVAVGLFVWLTRGWVYVDVIPRMGASQSGLSRSSSTSVSSTRPLIVSTHSSHQTGHHHRHEDRDRTDEESVYITPLTSKPDRSPVQPLSSASNNITSPSTPASSSTVPNKQVHNTKASGNDSLYKVLSSKKDKRRGQRRTVLSETFTGDDNEDEDVSHKQT